MVALIHVQRTSLPDRAETRDRFASDMSWATTVQDTSRSEQGQEIESATHHELTTADEDPGKD